MLVAEEEHDGARVVQLVHGVEVFDGGVVDSVDDGEVLYERGGFGEEVVHRHAAGVRGGAEAEGYDACVFAELGGVRLGRGVGEEGRRGC